MEKREKSRWSMAVWGEFSGKEEKRKEKKRKRKEFQNNNLINILIWSKID